VSWAALWQRDIPKSAKTSRAPSGTVFTGETGYKSYFIKVATTGTHMIRDTFNGLPS
jgi:hypothetical protein